MLRLLLYLFESSKIGNKKNRMGSRTDSQTTKGVGLDIVISYILLYIINFVVFRFSFFQTINKTT